MKKIIIPILLLILFFPATYILAEGKLYPFFNTKQQEQFYDITHQLRCLVCQNESIAESNAKFATDIREYVYQQTLAGQNSKQITKFLVSRYSNFIRYKPPLRGSTILLWFVPLLFLFISFLVVNHKRDS